MPKHDENLLLFLAQQSGLWGKAKTSTSKIAGHFGVSQQTASRKLRELHKTGLIELVSSPTGCTVSIEKAGISLLNERLASMQLLFGNGSKNVLEGTVKIGLGEGKYYVSRPCYLKQFREKLGFKPFFGTLNLLVDKASLQSFISGINPIQIEGFRTDERSFGNITAFRANVNGKQNAAMLFPERTAHAKNEVEVIAPINLRKKFRLKEGSRVSLSQQA